MLVFFFRRKLYFLSHTRYPWTTDIPVHTMNAIEDITIVLDQTPIVQGKTIALIENTEMKQVAATVVAITLPVVAMAHHVPQHHQQ